MTQKEIDGNERKMYLQIIESDKTTPEAKWEAQYWLWHMQPHPPSILDMQTKEYV